MWRRLTSTGFCGFIGVPTGTRIRFDRSSLFLAYAVADLKSSNCDVDALEGSKRMSGLAPYSSSARHWHLLIGRGGLGNPIRWTIVRDGTNSICSHGRRSVSNSLFCNSDVILSCPPRYDLVCIACHFSHIVTAMTTINLVFYSAPSLVSDVSRMPTALWSNFNPGQHLRTSAHVCHRTSSIALQLIHFYVGFNACYILS